WVAAGLLVWRTGPGRAGRRGWPGPHPAARPPIRFARSGGAVAGPAGRAAPAQAGATSARPTRPSPSTTLRRRITRQPRSINKGVLLADDLDADRAFARPVELGEDDGLELAQREIAVVDPDREGPTEQHGSEMRAGVAPLAVRDARIVVTVARAIGDQPLEQSPEIFHQSALELVDEERARRVKRVDERDSRGHGERPDRGRHERGDVRDLGASRAFESERRVA